MIEPSRPSASAKAKFHMLVFVIIAMVMLVIVLVYNTSTSTWRSIIENMVRQVSNLEARRRTKRTGKAQTSTESIY